jgi:hypothetical protein
MFRGEGMEGGNGRVREARQYGRLDGGRIRRRWMLLSAAVADSITYHNGNRQVRAATPGLSLVHDIPLCTRQSCPRAI